MVVLLLMYTGIPPYSYQWSNGSTSVVDTLLGAGTYTATVTDGNGCNMTATANLSYFCGNTISGRVFFDNNNNCQQDSAEVGASNYNVYATNGSYIAYGSTNSAGDYE